MKRPKVFAILGADTGCELYRIKYPFVALWNHGYQANWGMRDKVTPEDLQDCDLVVLPRAIPESSQDADEMIHLMARLSRDAGVPVVYETDDDFLHVEEHNPASEVITPHIEGTKKLMMACNAMTVSTPHLAKMMREFNPNVYVLPNCLDPRVWQAGRDRIEPLKDSLVVGWTGSSSHIKDLEILEEVWPALADKYPKVKFFCGGFWTERLKELLGDRLVTASHVPPDVYPQMVAQIDIGCVPLQDTLFNRSKSDIKFLEMAILGIPVVASTVEPYLSIKHGFTGYLASDTQSWIAYVSRIIRDKELRRKIGQNARQYVLGQRNIQKECLRWARAYAEITTASVA